MNAQARRIKLRLMSNVKLAVVTAVLSFLVFSSFSCFFVQSYSNGYEVIVDYFASGQSWYSNEPFNLIRRGQTIILSFNNMYTYLQDAPSSWFYTYYNEEYQYEQKWVLFLGYLKLENAVITAVDFPPPWPQPSNNSVVVIPFELWSLFDQPVNDSFWDFNVPPYPTDGKYHRDEIAVINETTIKLLSKLYAFDVDRLSIHIKILAHPATVKLTLIPADSNGIAPTIPYISVGSKREHYSFGEDIPLTKQSVAVNPPAEPNVYIPRSFNNFFALPNAVAFATSVSFSLLFALPIPLYFLFARRLKRQHPLLWRYRQPCKYTDSNSKLTKAIKMHRR